MGEKIEKIPRRIDLESMAQKWWFYLLLIILYFIPSCTSKSYDYSETPNVVLGILKNPLEPYEWLSPFFHIATIVLVISLLYFFGDKITRIFSVYVGTNFLFMAFTQNMAITEKAFWAPPKPDFDPLYLLSSHYGLAFCLTTPVFLGCLPFTIQL